VGYSVWVLVGICRLSSAGKVCLEYRLHVGRTQPELRISARLITHAL
jgi:hypothetical protein